MELQTQVVHGEGLLDLAYFLLSTRPETSSVSNFQSQIYPHFCLCICINDQVIPGSTSVPVRSLAWTLACDGHAQRLFGASLNGTIFEVDYRKDFRILVCE